MALGKFTITQTYPMLGDAPATGKVRIDVVSPTGNRIIDADGNLIFSGPKTVVLDTAGSFSIDLPTDVTAGESTTIGYRVTAQLKHNNLAPVEFWARPAGTTVYLAKIDTQVVVPLTPTGLSTTDADARYATIATQTTVETGRLSDAALSGTYAKAPAGVTRPLALPTPDGNPNVAHPSVVHIPEGWNGYRYWMAFTPFPDEARENPCIVASNDKVNWVVPEGLTNPVTSLASINAEGWWYNSDTELVYDRATKTLVMYERVVNELNEAIRRRASTDGVTWTAPVETLRRTMPAAGGTRLAISQTVVIEDNGSWTMWVVNRTAAVGSRVERYTSTDKGVTWSAATTVTTPVQGGTASATAGSQAAGQPDVWHIHACRAGGQYHMLVNTTWGTGSLLYWVSDDGLTWTTGGPLVLRSGKFMDANGFYRSAIVPATSGDHLRFDLYVTMLDGTSSTTQTNNNFRIALMENISPQEGVRKNRRPVAYLPAPMFGSGLNAPSSALVNGRWHGWIMPGAGTETSIVTAASLRGHERVRLKVVWCNMQATTGNVSFQVQTHQYVDGDGAGAYVYTPEKIDVPAAGQYVVKITDLGIIAVRPGPTGEGADGINLRLHRRTFHNTLTNDIAVLAVIIEQP